MCDKCQELETRIHRYRKFVAQGLDPLTVKRINALIRELQQRGHSQIGLDDLHVGLGPQRLPKDVQQHPRHFGEENPRALQRSCTCDPILGAPRPAWNEPLDPIWIRLEY